MMYMYIYILYLYMCTFQGQTNDLRFVGPPVFAPFVRFLEALL